MQRKEISYEKFSSRVIDLWLNQWFLLTCGNYQKNHFNTMTVAWGSIGAMWNKPFAQVVVRPTRYTYKFMEQYHSFTLCSFGRKYRDDLQLLGTKSGRDGNKIAETKLEVVASHKVSAPSFKQAELVIECKKIYWQDFDQSHFLDPRTERLYPHHDYHRIYYGEILYISQAV